MKVVNKRDKNTRGLAKVVSALEYLLDAYADARGEAICAALECFDTAKFDLIQERRNLGCALLNELDQQARGAQ
jgi:hypothetical protein